MGAPTLLGDDDGRAFYLLNLTDNACPLTSCACASSGPSAALLLELATGGTALRTIARIATRAIVVSLSTVVAWCAALSALPLRSRIADATLRLEELHRIGYEVAESIICATHRDGVALFEVDDLYRLHFDETGLIHQ